MNVRALFSLLIGRPITHRSVQGRHTCVVAFLFLGVDLSLPFIRILCSIQLCFDLHLSYYIVKNGSLALVVSVVHCSSSPSSVVMELSSNSSMAIPSAPGLAGICHGSAAGSQPGTLGNDSSVIMPSQASPEALATYPIAKRNCSRSDTPEIITQHVTENENVPLDFSVLPTKE